LRETLVSTGKVALARVVLHTRQYLAAVMPLESALVMVKLRWPAEVHALDILELGADVAKPKLDKRELDMAKRLVADMSGDWTPDEYIDEFEAKIMQLVDTKANDGQIEDVETDPGQEERKTADVIDLTELLKRSLGGKPAATPKPVSKSARAAKKKPVAEKSASTPARKPRKAS